MRYKANSYNICFKNLANFKTKVTQETPTYIAYPSTICGHKLVNLA